MRNNIGPAFTVGEEVVWVDANNNLRHGVIANDPALEGTSAKQPLYLNVDGVQRINLIVTESGLAASPAVDRVAHVRKLTKQELTQAVRQYARKHGFSASTVRACTSVRLAAIEEYKVN